jgi:hypothetical protein
MGAKAYGWLFDRKILESLGIIALALAFSAMSSDDVEIQWVICPVSRVIFDGWSFVGILDNPLHCL